MRTPPKIVYNSMRDACLRTGTSDLLKGHVYSECAGRIGQVKATRQYNSRVNRFSPLYRMV